MLYLDTFTFPSAEQEMTFLYPKDRTPEEIVNDVSKDYRARNDTGSKYPFEILSRNKLKILSFDRVTVFCGGNGSGKITALNIIAQRLGLKRENAFNSGRFFQDYLNMCDYDAYLGSDGFIRRLFGEETGLNLPADSRIIVSDDVFAYTMNRRKTNDEIRRAKLEDEYNSLNLMHQGVKPPKKLFDSVSPEQSNGETALRYFAERTENPGLYLLDEPENSLSVENQTVLAEYIAASARFYNCQFIIATHSPVFLAIKDARVYDFDETPICVKKWTELDSVKRQYHFFKAHEQEFV